MFLIDFMKQTNCRYGSSMPLCNCVVQGCEIPQMNFNYPCILRREGRTLRACGDSRTVSPFRMLHS